MAVAVMGAVPTYAQVCKETTATSTTGAANLTCDMRYRDSVITCDAPNSGDILGTRPSCPPKPMQMISTPKLSYVADYTPYLYIFPRDPKDPSLPYSGPYATGTPGDASTVFKMFGNSSPNAKRLAGCTAQIHTPSDPTSNEDWAKLVRLQIDNCTNQYILRRSTDVFQGEMPNRLITVDDPTVGAKRVDLQSECQPLKMVKAGDDDYNPTDYLKVAWIKALQDANYRKSTPPQTKCVPCTISNIGPYVSEDYQPPCDHEPHLPCAAPLNQGLTLDNPMPPPDPFPEVTLSSLDALPYEAILDPTHPFSPRWDFLVNDRDYSNPSARWYNARADSHFAALAAIYLMLQDYMSDSTNAVFCAGVKKAKDGSDSKTKADKEVRVDVLSFRQGAFESTLGRRVVFNEVCYNHRAQYTSGQDGYVLPYKSVVPVAFGSFCNTITAVNPYTYPYVYGRDFDCWSDCFGLSGKADGENKKAPCATSYVEKDLKIKRIPGALNAFESKANCGNSMAQACADLRKPFAPLNKLKMRYHNPDDSGDSDHKNMVLKSDMPVITDGALEGTTFGEYFGNHMPYPRLWDTGKSLQKTASNDPQPPTDTTGQYTAIVGVGREAAAQVASDNAPKVDGKSRADIFTDQRCKTMGYGGYIADLASMSVGRAYRRGISSFAGVNVDWPDPMTSWTEMKFYQANTARKNGLSCLARYEKVFKPGSAENMVLMATGAPWDKGYVSKCTRGSGGEMTNCQTMTVKQYRDAGSPTGDATYTYIPDKLSDGVPNSWRGYMSTFDLSTKFPVFGGSVPALVYGLSNAQVGDIITLPFGLEFGFAVPGYDKIGLAKVALVVETNLPSTPSGTCTGGCYVRVLEPDNGKWPDICGTTDTAGEMKSRYYYMPNQLPQDVRDEYARIGQETVNCKETKLSQCEMSDWNNMILYRIRYDQRSGCKDDEKASKCK